MTQRQYFLATAVILAAVALAHLARVIFGWSISIESWDAPMWLSWVAMIVTAVIAYYGFKLSRESE